MKDRRKSIVKIQLEIQELEEQIDFAKKCNKLAFASRLEKIKELKNKRLNSWLQI
tara:strand:- start:3 stop:167 length:165 start_codon:yes stop_codon:yes gene_type:complete